MLLSNARNDVRVEGGAVVKRSADLSGELFFYQELALRVPRLRHLFPRLLSGSPTRLELELVPAKPLCGPERATATPFRRLCRARRAPCRWRGRGCAHDELRRPPSASSLRKRRRASRRLNLLCCATRREFFGCCWRGLRRASRRASDCLLEAEKFCCDEQATADCKTAVAS